MQFTDTEWRLVFRQPQPGVKCGLLRSRIDVEPLARHQCRVTVHDRGTDEFRGSFVVRASAERVQADIERRMRALDLAGEVTAAVEDGEWWRDVRLFRDLGWARTVSVAGVRCRKGSWGTDSIKRTRMTKVLDFGPDGVTLRGWRTHAVMPWGTIDTIEAMSDRGPSSPRAVGRSARHGRRPSGTIVRLRSRAGDELIFHTVLSSTADIAARLSALQDQLARS